jgi:hypothetical protein
MKYKEMQKALFSLQPFRLFALNCFLSALGNGMSYIAMIWLIIVRNNSISTITLLIICFWLPKKSFNNSQRNSNDYFIGFFFLFL